MKKILLFFSCISIFCLLLFFPEITLNASRKGLALWYDTLIPTLLPFLIISQLLMQSNLIEFFQKPLAPVCRYLFHISESGIFCILCGFLCGYPVGARLITLQIREERLSADEGQYLLSFCNNVSPMFCISFGIRFAMGCSNPLTALLAIYGAPILLAVMTRPKLPAKASNTKKQTPMPANIFRTIDICIIDSFSILIKLCGYLILFSILIHTLHAWLQNRGSSLLTVLACLLEITNGLSMTAVLPRGLFRELLGILALSFGGLCCICQTNSVLEYSNLSVKTYLKAKLITTLLALFLYSFFCLIF